jgi:cell volume regulation protein A
MQKVCRIFSQSLGINKQEKMILDHLILIGSALILLSIVIAKLSDNLGVPTLILFLAVGMLAGSEGFGGIYFDDAKLAQSIGIIALIFILFAGGLDTQWSAVRATTRQSFSLATLGVLLTALLTGVFVAYILDISLYYGLLFGAILSSTDAAAVFSVLRSKHVHLRGNLKPLLEFESGSNDPMAIFLTIGMIELIKNPESTVFSIALLFIRQMGFGALFGVCFGKIMTWSLNKLKVIHEGFYPVLTLAFAAFTYAASASIGGSGFLAVYIAGMILGNSDFVQKKSLIRFFDGFAWLGQIAMFLTLGLLVFPSRLLPITWLGLCISLFLMFVARPVSVYISLLFSNLQWKEKTFIAWVGLRGAVPIILATFPLLAGLSYGNEIFDVVFFVVLTSALVQGWSIPLAAKILNVGAPFVAKPQYPIEFAPVQGSDTELVDLIVPFNSSVIGKSIVELGMPHDSLIVLISRNDDYLVPSGGTVLQEGDTVLVLVNKQNLPAVRSILSRQSANSNT